MLSGKQAELQKKFGHDRERLGQETMKLYKEEGVNPMASCLPLLLQMPIFISLFRVLEGVASGHVRGHFFKVNPHLVDSLNNATIFGARLSDRTFPFETFGSTQVLGVILVVLMVGIFFVTQLQLTRKNMPPESQTGQAAQMQKMMLYFFPVVYAMSSAVLPIGVLIYWLTSNLWTMGQQGLLIRNNPAPNTPAFIDWEERMLAKGKDPQAIIEERAEKRRRAKKGNSVAPTAPAAGGEAEAPKVVRQQVTRQTVRTSEDGKNVVQRQQPKSQSRSARKKS